MQYHCPGHENIPLYPSTPAQLFHCTAGSPRESTKVCIKALQKEKREDVSFKKEKVYLACEFLRRNLLILMNTRSEVAECYDHFVDMEKGCGWLLKIPQEKDKAGISPRECWLGPCLKPQDHTSLRNFLFLLAFQGTCCCLFTSVQLPNCGLMAACLRLVQKREETTSEPRYCWKLQCMVQTCLILDVTLRPLRMNIQKCWVIGIVNKVSRSHSGQTP